MSAPLTPEQLTDHLRRSEFVAEQRRLEARLAALEAAGQWLAEIATMVCECEVCDKHRSVALAVWRQAKGEAK